VEAFAKQTPHLVDTGFDCDSPQLPIHISGPIHLHKVFQNGWWRLKHEEVLAPAPAEESGAGVD
jgi:hypothetical protein